MIITVKYYRGLPTLKEHIERAIPNAKYHLLPCGTLEVMGFGSCAIKVMRKEELALTVQLDTTAIFLESRVAHLILNITSLHNHEVQALTKLGHLPGEADMMLKMQS